MQDSFVVSFRGFLPGNPIHPTTPTTSPTPWNAASTRRTSSVAFGLGQSTRRSSARSMTSTAFGAICVTTRGRRPSQKRRKGSPSPQRLPLDLTTLRLVAPLRVRDVVVPAPQIAANLATVCAQRGLATTATRWEFILFLIAAGGSGLHLQVIV